jgi:hypothetical protein
MSGVRCRDGSGEVQGDLQARRLSRAHRLQLRGVLACDGERPSEVQRGLLVEKLFNTGAWKTLASAVRGAITKPWSVTDPERIGIVLICAAAYSPVIPTLMNRTITFSFIFAALTTANVARTEIWNYEQTTNPTAPFVRTSVTPSTQTDGTTVSFLDGKNPLSEIHPHVATKPSESAQGNDQSKKEPTSGIWVMSQSKSEVGSFSKIAVIETPYTAGTVIIFANGDRVKELHPAPPQ